MAAFLSPERANSEARATKKIRICARRSVPLFSARANLPTPPPSTCPAYLLPPRGDRS